MTPIEVVVLAASAATIGWINWYFFLAGTPARPRPSRAAAPDPRRAG